MTQEFDAYWKHLLASVATVTRFRTQTYEIPPRAMKRVIKTDSDIKKVNQEVPLMLVRIAEAFILDLTSRTREIARKNKRKILKRCDLISATTQDDQFDFLIDLFPSETLQHRDDAHKVDAGAAGPSERLEL
jgi:histone H3/H4